MDKYAISTDQVEWLEAGNTREEAIKHGKNTFNSDFYIAEVLEFDEDSIEFINIEKITYEHS